MRLEFAGNNFQGTRKCQDSYRSSYPEIVLGMHGGNSLRLFHRVTWPWQHIAGYCARQRWHSMVRRVCWTVASAINIAKLSAGDSRMLIASRVEARKRFNENRNLDPQSQECTKALDEAEGVSMILRQNIVQGAGAQEGDNFSECCSTCRSRMY